MKYDMPYKQIDKYVIINNNKQIIIIHVNRNILYTILSS